jgi:LacI family transcriptional regulator
MKARPAVALLIETSNSYSRDLLHGIHAYLGQHRPWAIRLSEQGRGNEPPPWLATWRGDGIIARIENAAIERAVRKVGVPVVNVSATGRAPEIPAVTSRSASIAGLAAQHLLDRGFNHFAYCGDARFPWSEKHGRHFVDFLRKHGHRCVEFPSHARDFADWAGEFRRLRRWLLDLPKPVGVMACYDSRGQQLLDVCRDANLRVPGEVAVIGQHNDELLCDLCDPPLSSVIPNASRAGYAAAELLEKMMAGKRLPARPVEIEPIGVATRQSTDIVALSDAKIAEAVRFIHLHAHENISVSDVLQAVPMSRTLLERKFRALLKRSPAEEIIACRIRLVRKLLSTTSLSVAEIADRTGFSSPEYLSSAFKRETGAGPREFRRIQGIRRG